MVENKAARFYVPRCVLSEFDLDTVGFSSVVKPGFKDWDGIAGQASPQVSSPLPSIPVPFSPFSSLSLRCEAVPKFSYGV